MQNYVNEKGEMGFEFEGMFITNPMLSICARFEVDPIKEYGLTQSEVDKLIKFNKLGEINE